MKDRKERKKCFMKMNLVFATMVCLSFRATAEMDYADVLDAKGVNFSVGGTDWKVDSSHSLYGGSCLGSGTSGSDWIECLVEGPAVVQFAVLVTDCEGGYVNVYVDDVQKDSVYSEFDWRLRSVAVANGMHTVKWKAGWCRWLLDAVEVGYDVQTWKGYECAGFSCTADGYVWRFNKRNGGAIITGYDDGDDDDYDWKSAIASPWPEGVVTIPRELDGCPVVGLGTHAFSGCSSIMNVDRIPGTEIPWGLFENCSNLESARLSLGVREIGKEAFYGCGKLTSVYIPYGVTNINQSAFCGCSGLTEVFIPDTVSNVGRSAFAACSGLKKIYTPSANVSRLQQLLNGSGFSSSGVSFVDVASGKLTESVDGTTWTFDVKDNAAYLRSNSDVTMKGVLTVPEVLGGYPVKGVQMSAFSGQTGIISLVLQEGITNVEEYAFSNCTGLKSVVVPKSVVAIGENAFAGCTSLETMVLPFVGASRHQLGWHGVLGYVFGGGSSHDGVDAVKQFYGDGSNDYRMYYIPRSLRSVTITDQVELYYGAFFGCSRLTSIELPETLKTIGYRAFCNCTALKSIALPDGVLSIHEKAFMGCTGLTSLDLPCSVTRIGGSAFTGCSGLEELTIPFVGESRQPDSIEEGCFGRIFGETKYDGGLMTQQVRTYYIPSKLTSVTITGCTKIPRSAFKNCTNLESIVLSEGLNTVEDEAFNNCTGLKEIAIPPTVTTLGTAVFRGCSSLQAVKVQNLQAWCGLTMPSGGNPLEVAHRLYVDDEELVELVIPQEVTTVNEYVFAGCHSLKSVVIHDGVTSLGAGCFSDCKNLEDVKIGAGVTTLSAGLFAGCSSLAEIEIPDTVTGIANGTFGGCTGLTSIIVPNSVKQIGNDYIAVEGAFWGCTSLKSIQLPFVGHCKESRDHFGVIFGTGSCEGRTDVKRQTASGTGQFFAIPSSLESVTITDDTILGAGAFSNCSQLKEIDIVKGATVLPDYAFYGCSGITSINVSPTVTSIGEGAFSGCQGLLNFGIPAAVTVIGPSAFENCSGLSSIELPSGLSVVSMNSFRNTGISRVDIPYGVTKIDSGAFHRCSALSEVLISESVTEIGPGAFAYCSSLVEVSIPPSVQKIGRQPGYLSAFDASYLRCVNAGVGDAPRLRELLALDMNVSKITFVEPSNVITYLDTKDVANPNPSTAWISTGIVFESLSDAEGWLFVGWEPKSVAPGYVGDIFATAKWERVTNNVMFVVCDHLRQSDEVSLVQQIEYGMCPEVPQLEAETGWKFIGWSHDPTVPVLGEMVFEAVCEPITYSVSYLGTKGADNPNPCTFTVTNHVVFAPLEDVDGWHFMSWMPAEIVEGTISNVTATAVWENTVAVTSIDDLVTAFGENVEIVREIRTESELALFNDFLKKCAITAVSDLSEAQKQFAYQSFKLAEITTAPKLFEEEPVLKIDDIELSGGNLSLTISLTAGAEAIKLAKDKLAERIRVGTTLGDITDKPTIVASPAADGTSLTFTITPPVGNQAFVKVQID